MTTNRKPSASLTKIVRNLDENKLRRTRDRMLIAARIADALNAKGITQKKFAKMIGKSESEISEWLSGNRNFTIDTLSDIKNCLGIELFNTYYIQTSFVSKADSKRRMNKSCTLKVYDNKNNRTINISNVWLTQPPKEYSIAF